MVSKNLYECKQYFFNIKTKTMVFFSGIRVLTGVDATKLEEHKILSSEKFDLVVFNFPHVGGKMRIEKNRELLKKFFMSVQHILQYNGQVFMSLCDGQGGTPVDRTLRKWNDSWQVTEMAAYGDFILIAIEPFDSLLFETYTVTGYRSLEKQFNTQGSLTHIFNLSEKPNIKNIAPKQSINLKKNYEKQINWKGVFEENRIKNCDNDNFLSLYSNSYKFDITFSISPEFNDIKLFETLYNYAGLIIDDVQFLNSYIFPDLKETRTFRITYYSKKFPLYRKLVIEIHKNVIATIIEKNLNVVVTR